MELEVHFSSDDDALGTSMHFSSDDDDAPGTSLAVAGSKRKREDDERDSDALSLSPAGSSNDELDKDMDDDCESSANSVAASLSDPDAVSVEMELEGAGSEDPWAQTQERWSPGVNCGPYFGWATPLLEQGLGGTLHTYWGYLYLPVWSPFLKRFVLRPFWLFWIRLGSF